MYQKRFIAFIDLLGFGSLVELSAADESLPEKILDALNSILPEAIHKDAYASINHELIPESEFEAVKELSLLFNKSVRAQHPVAITYFSDSLVLSAPHDDAIASQMILDLIAKLSIRLWMDHQLLLRGGLTLGRLIHMENGPLFGPAMNRAYYIESKIARFPRVVIDNSCYESYKKVDTFQLFESLFETDGELRYASLGTALRHIINDSSLALAGEPVLAKYRQCLSQSSSKLLEIEAMHTDDSIKAKYQWLAQEVRARASEVDSP